MARSVLQGLARGPAPAASSLPRRRRRRQRPAPQHLRHVRLGEHLTAEHDGVDVPGVADVVERIAGEHDQVGESAGGDGAESIETQRPRAIERDTRGAPARACGGPTSRA